MIKCQIICIVNPSQKVLSVKIFLGRTSKKNTLYIKTAASPETDVKLNIFNTGLGLQSHCGKMFLTSFLPKRLLVGVPFFKLSQVSLDILIVSYSWSKSSPAWQAITTASVSFSSSKASLRSPFLTASLRLFNVAFMWASPFSDSFLFLNPDNF